MKPPEPEPTPALQPADINPDSALAQTQRCVAETLKLLAEANESRARQLTELERIGAWLQHGWVEQARRLKRASADGLAAGGAAETETADEPQPGHASDPIPAAPWPAALGGPPWRVWRTTLLARAAQDPLAALLLARLHLLAALERAGRPAPLELIRDLGRSAYEAAVEAEPLARALGQAAAGRFEVRTVRVGDRVDNKFMKPATGGCAEVRTVTSWAVRDQNGLWQFPAEIA